MKKVILWIVGILAALCIAGAYLKEHNGVLSLGEAQECLAQVHWKDLVWENGTVEDTQYSNVYDQAAIVLHLRNWNDYETTCTFKLF